MFEDDFHLKTNPAQFQKEGGVGGGEAPPPGPFPGMRMGGEGEGMPREGDVREVGD